jgi:hypothetical protein
MKRHIAATPRCKNNWEREIISAASNGKRTRKSTTTHLDIHESSFDYPNTWDESHDFVPDASPDPDRVEDVDFEDSVPVRQSPDTKNRRFVEGYPRPAGVPIGHAKTKFQILYENHMGEGQGIYTPFTNNDEWELAQWLSRRVGQKGIDEYLNLPIVSAGVDIFSLVLLNKKNIG